ncbi:MAG: MFS transporter [Leptospirales bacterium]
MKTSPDLNPYRLTSGEKRIAIALAFIQFTHITDFIILMPLGPTLSKLFNIDNSEFSYLVSSYMLSAGFTALAGSFFIDRFNRKKSLLFIFMGFLIGTFFCGLSNSFSMLLVSRMITGAFGGLLNALIFSMIGDAFAYEKRGAATGVIMAAFSAASVAGIPISLEIANRIKWNTPFFVLTALGTLIAIYTLYAIPSTKKVIAKHSIKDIVVVKSHYTAFFLTMTIMIAGFSLIPYLSNYLVFNTVFTEQELPLMYFFGGGATFFSARLIGYLADRFGKKKTFYLIAGLSVIPFYAISRLDDLPAWMIFVITTIFFILVSGRLVPAMALLTSSVKNNLRGAFMTTNTAIQQFSSAGAMLVAGAIITSDANNVISGFETVSYLSILANCLSIYFVYRLKVVKEPKRL